MIDDVTFTAEMTILAARFPGASNMPNEVIARYYEYLSPRMTTEEFQAAARQIFALDTFWPAPLRFVEVVQGNPKAMADEAWNALVTAMRSGRPHDASPEAIATLRRSGATYRDLMEASDYRLAQLERGFKAAFAAPSEVAGRALPEAQPFVLEGLGS